MGQKSHWEKVYGTKQITDVNWYQPTPQVSLDFVKELNIPKDAAIIDVGGGDSYFADHLLLQGYTNITVLDISESAIARAKERLGEKAAGITWIVSDILEFVPPMTYDFWHDRATFHFLTREDQVSAYLSVVNKALAVSGKMVIGAFSETGPEKCSGLPVKQYSEQSLTSLIKKWFRKIKCIHTDHITPFNTLQNFLFCSFQKSLL